MILTEQRYTVEGGKTGVTAIRKGYFQNKKKFYEILSSWNEPSSEVRYYVTVADVEHNRQCIGVAYKHADRTSQSFKCAYTDIGKAFFVSEKTPTDVERENEYLKRKIKDLGCELKEVETKAKQDIDRIQEDSDFHEDHV